MKKIKIKAWRNNHSHRLIIVGSVEQIAFVSGLKNRTVLGSVGHSTMKTVGLIKNWVQKSILLP